MDPQSRGRRVAFFGGTFDPPHLGHLGVARAAQEALGLDLVLFAPVGAQPLKPQGTAAGFDDRLAMTRLAIASDPAFALSLADAPKSSGAPNYTFETLVALRAQLPPSSVLFCLMGADSFAGFSRWHRAADIPFVASLIVASRPSESQWSLDNLDSALPQGFVLEAAPEPDAVESGVALRRSILRNPAGLEAPFYLLPGLHIDISASQIRDQIHAQATPSIALQCPESALLPAPVLEYIRAHNLYL
ncbi:MAG: nicotinate (nicotinamide) nucleotide adenylyltransferase [Terracidiphilus sp.]|jgi:nicotinate-nucleotide adenylyltransferase